MHRRSTFVVLALFCAASPLRLFAQSAPEIQKAIADLESKWAAAQQEGKAGVVGSLLADRFISVSTEGQLSTRDQLLAHMKPGKWEAYGISDVNVIVYDHIAIATGLWSGKGMVGDHKVDMRERWTDTWVRMPGGLWQCVASQQTAIQP
jgi:hypothetical protein